MADESAADEKRVEEAQEERELTSYERMGMADNHVANDAKKRDIFIPKPPSGE